MEENDVKYCPRCGTANDIYASYCNNCGQKLNASYRPYQEIREWDLFSIFGFALSILTYVLDIGLLGSIGAIVLCSIGLSRTKNSMAKGRALAIAGLVISIIMVVLIILLLLFFIDIYSSIFTHMF